MEETWFDRGLMEKNLEVRKSQGEIICASIVNGGNLEKHYVIWGCINRRIGNRPLEVIHRWKFLLFFPQQVFLEGFLCVRAGETLVNSVDMFSWRSETVWKEEDKWAVNYKAARETMRGEV